jgi:NADH:ubiquinone oxidoreductase subunit 2 (subunit N)
MYSSVANMGFILLAVASAAAAMPLRTGNITYAQNFAMISNYTLFSTDAGFAVCLFLIIYMLGLFGIFAILLTAFKRDAQQYVENIEEMSDMSQDYGALTTVLCVNMLSFIGLPPLAGFPGKFYLFQGTMEYVCYIGT